MGNIDKPRPDNYMKLIKGQKAPKLEKQKPETLGEACETTNWDEHIKMHHGIISFAQIVDDPHTKQKLAHVHTAEIGRKYIAVTEVMHGYRFIWILLVEENSNRILEKFNSSQIHFVNWDDPKPKKKVK